MCCTFSNTSDAALKYLGDPEYAYKEYEFFNSDLPLVLHGKCFPNHSSCWSEYSFGEKGHDALAYFPNKTLRTHWKLWIYGPDEDPVFFHVWFLLVGTLS